MRKTAVKAKRPTSEEVLKSLQALIVKQGYAVVGQPSWFYRPFRKGQILDNFAGFMLSGNSLVVEGDAEFADWKSQAEQLGAMNPTWPQMNPEKHDAKGNRFYKVNWARVS